MAWILLLAVYVWHRFEAVTRRSKLIIALAVVAVIGITARLALPQILRSHVNARLAEMGDYAGRVANIDVALLRGAYTLHDLVVVKREADNETPFLDLAEIDISLHWRALLSGELVGEIDARAPVLNLVQAETDRDTQLGTGVNWPAQVRELFPFQFNHVEVVDGLVTFRAPGIEADDSLTLRDAHLVLRNLTNVAAEDQDAFADLELTGTILGNAPLELTGRIDPNAELPTFDVNLSLEATRLVDVNPWLERFVNVDAEQGTFSMYTELAASNGRFEGYVKPLMEDPKIFRIDEAADGPFRKVWEGLVELAAKVFKNRRSDQVATRIPLSGELENPDAGMLAAIVNLLRNAFVSAFSRSLEGTIGLRDVDPDADTDPSEENDTEDRG